MRKLIESTFVSLNGVVEDPSRWAMAASTRLQRPIRSKRSCDPTAGWLLLRSRPKTNTPSRWRFRPPPPRTFRLRLAASAYSPQRRLRPNRAPCSVQDDPTTSRTHVQARTAPPGTPFCVLKTDNRPRVPDGYSSLSTYGHLRVSGTQFDEPICRQNVPADALPWTHGKEGVDGSTPSEGFRLLPAQRRIPLSGSAACSLLGVHGRPRTSTVGALRSSSSRIACSRPSRARWP
jgi:hypothetical protein